MPVCAGGLDQLVRARHPLPSRQSRTGKAGCPHAIHGTAALPRLHRWAGHAVDVASHIPVPENGPASSETLTQSPSKPNRFPGFLSRGSGACHGLAVLAPIRTSHEPRQPSSPFHPHGLRRTRTDLTYALGIHAQRPSWPAVTQDNRCKRCKRDMKMLPTSCSKPGPFLERGRRCYRCNLCGERGADGMIVC